MKTKPYLCIDIGGTKLSTGLSDGQTVWAITRSPIAKGIQPLLTQIQHVIQAHDDTVSAILIGCPGNIIDDHIAAGSAQNLGTFPGEFDGFNLKNALSPYTPRPIAVFNDARAQMAGAYRLMEDTLKGVTAIGYIGPGTGLGGGFAKIDSHGLHPVTDGHIFDIYLQRPPGDPRFPETDIAENMLSGRAFTERTGLSAQDAAATPDKFKPIMQDFGYSMATLIRSLYTDTAVKPTAQPWTDADRAFIQTVRHYVLGGGLGTSQPFGAWLLDATRRQLQLWEVPVEIQPIPDVQQEALIGLVNLYLG